jgi:hypothetical protein
MNGDSCREQTIPRSGTLAVFKLLKTFAETPSAYRLALPKEVDHKWLASSFCRQYLAIDNPVLAQLLQVLPDRVPVARSAAMLPE